MADTNDSAPEGLEQFIAPQAAQKQGAPLGMPPSEPSPAPEAPSGSEPPPGLDQFIHKEANEEKRSSLSEIGKTFAEGVAEGAVPLARTIETSTGIATPEDIMEREEASPYIHGAGQVLGFVAPLIASFGTSALAKVGLGSLVSEAGVNAAAKVGLGAEKIGEAAFKGAIESGASKQAALAVQKLALAPLSTGSKIASAATKAAVEGGLIQTNDEVDRMMSRTGDPNESVETALGHIGFAAALGGGGTAILKSVPPLWTAVVAPKLSSVLEALKDKFGIFNAKIPEVVNEAKQQGMNVAPTVEGLMSENTTVKNAAKALQEGDSHYASQAQEDLANFKNDAQGRIVTALGKSPEDLGSLADLSEAEAGTQIKNNLAAELKTKIDPVSQKYDTIANRFKDVPVSEATQSALSDKLSEMASRVANTPSSPEYKLVNDAIAELPLQKSLENLRTYASSIGQRAAKEQLWGLAKDLRSAFMDAQSDALTSTVASDAPELMETHLAANKAYKELSNTIGSLNDRLHVGKYAGPSSFLRALNEMAPEDVLRRLSPKGDAALIPELSSKFPETTKAVQGFHLDKLLKGAADKAAPGELINTKTLFNSIKGMSPEMRGFLIPAEANSTMSSMQQMLEAIPSHMRPDKQGSWVSSLVGSAAGFATQLASHNPVTAVVTGALTKVLGQQVPDAARLALLRFLASDAPVEAGAFKSMVDFMHATIKGEKLLTSSSKNLFKEGAAVLPTSYTTSLQEREKLEKHMEQAQKDPNMLMRDGSNIGHYMPDHAAAMSQTASRVNSYLQSLKPSQDAMNPLDSKPVVSREQKAEYNRALDLANKPLMVMEGIKNGSVTPKDIQHIKAMYPALYNRISGKLQSELVNAMHKETTIPYKTKMGISLFLGRPMDSTMTPSGIMAAQFAQASSESQQQPQANGEAPGSRPKHSMNALNKLPGQYQTASQARQAEKISKA